MCEGSSLFVCLDCRVGFEERSRRQRDKTQRQAVLQEIKDGKYF